MSKTQVRVVVVRKRTTVTLLVLLSAAMASLIYYLSGKAIAGDSDPLRQLVFNVMQRRNPVNVNAILVTLMPVIADVLFFVPWGFLMFLALDTPAQPRRTTYLLTVLAGAALATGMTIWQNFLPTRVTGVLDALINAFGALAGAMMGHLRKRVRVQFDY